MQLSDLPDVAPTAPTPMHWLATATAMAGVLALTGLFRTGDATASQAHHAAPRATASAPAGPRLPAPDPADATFPLGCGQVGTTVTAKSSGDLDGDGNPETVAAVRCDSASGTPPSAVYVLTAGRAAGAPRVVATLLSVDAQESVGKQFTIAHGTVLATLLGYSGSDVPRCCPDVQNKVAWTWHDGAFVRSEQSTGRSV